MGVGGRVGAREILRFNMSQQSSKSCPGITDKWMSRYNSVFFPPFLYKHRNCRCTAYRLTKGSRLLLIPHGSEERLSTTHVHTPLTDATKLQKCAECLGHACRFVNIATKTWQPLKEFPCMLKSEIIIAYRTWICSCVSACITSVTL